VPGSLPETIARHVNARATVRQCWGAVVGRVEYLCADGTYRVAVRVTVVMTGAQVGLIDWKYSNAVDIEC
jgi:hypothetical protein